MLKIDRVAFFKISICIFAFLLSFDPDWSSKALIILFISGLFNLEIKKTLLFHNLFVILLFGTLVYILCNIIFNGGSFLTKGFTFIGLCLLFHLVMMQTKVKINDLKYIFGSFILGVLVVGIINVINFFFQPDISGDIVIYNSWEKFSIIDIHKIYYATYLNFAYAILLNYIKKNKKYKKIIYCCFLIIYFLLYFTGSVSGILICFIITLLYFIKIWKRKLYKPATLFFFAVPFLILVLLSLDQFQTIFEQIDGEGSRIRNYNSNLKLFFDSPIFGHGIGNELDAMQKVRSKNSWEFKNHYNAHNQYFQILVGGGIIYLFLLFSLFVSLKNLILKQDWLCVSFCLIIFYIFIVESFLERHHGILFLTFFLNILLFINCSAKNRINLWE